MCVWGEGHRATGLPWALRTHTCSSVLPGSAQLPCLGVGHRVEAPKVGPELREEAPQPEGCEGTGSCPPHSQGLRRLSRPDLQFSTWRSQVSSQHSRARRTHSMEGETEAHSGLGV